MKEIKILSGDANQRIDKFLFKYFNAAPKSFVYKMLRKKRIKRNGKKADGNEMLACGDTLQMYLSEDTIDSFIEEKTVNKAERHFGIIYEDENIIVVLKPAGLLVHPDRAGDRNSLTDQILYYLNQKGQYDPSKSNGFTPAVCNRLDRNTGGIVIAGKTLAAVAEVNRMIARREIKKLYLTMVKGEFAEERELFGYHIKDELSNKVKILKKEMPGAKKVYTKVRPLCIKNNFSLLEIDLITGKSHQIRAHLKSMGHCVVGDRKYGDERVNRIFKEKYGLDSQFLFAHTIVFGKNNGILEYLSDKKFTASLPAVFEAIKKDCFGNCAENYDKEEI
ncbi:MAG: RluA family pseudouridine synthase [Firmicutes bacterium]|nr:RluA family pseudouridine synthase [Bacillota bacterium]